MLFKSAVKEIGKFCNDVDNKEIKSETMFFNSDLNFAYENGGAITRNFIDALPSDWQHNVVFDSRVHMLMPGWYPAIPGWHHDDIPRPTIPVGQHFATSGQPDYDNPRYKSEHILGLVNADICPTQFAIGDAVMPAILDGDLIYRNWHKVVNEKIELGELTILNAKDRQLYYFDCNSFHQSTSCVGNGWRWFGRVSRNTDRVSTITNEIRKQAQIYLELPMQGW
jgi:hypothetical protein